MKPIIVLGGLSYNDHKPVTIRIKNIKRDSFDMSL